MQEGEQGGTARTGDRCWLREDRRPGQPFLPRPAACRTSGPACIRVASHEENWAAASNEGHLAFSMLAGLHALIGP